MTISYTSVFAACLFPIVIGKMKSWLWVLQVALAQSCSKSFAYFSGSGTEVDRGGSTTPAVPTSIQWNSIPGAVNVWETNSYTTGTYVFLHKFALPGWLLPRLTKATLWIRVDDSYVVKLNEVAIGSAGLNMHTHDIPLNVFLGSDSINYRENVLRKEVYNYPSYGALLYKLEITFA